MMNVIKYRNPMMMHRFLENMVDEGVDNSYAKNHCRRPAANILDEGKSFVIELVVPGIDKNDIRIDLEKNELKVSYEAPEKKDQPDREFTRREFLGGSFCRSFAIPDSIDVEKISANYDKGILTIELPKKKEAIIKKEIRIA